MAHWANWKDLLQPCGTKGNQMPGEQESVMTSSTKTLYKSYIIEEYRPIKEPFYLPVADEIELFEAAYHQRIPVLFKGPTGCGKTRFVEYLSLIHI